MKKHLHGMQGVSGSNPLGSTSRIKPVIDRFLAACKSRCFNAEKLNIIFDAQNDAQKFGVPCGRGCFLRYLIRSESAHQVVDLSSLESICMASHLY